MEELEKKYIRLILNRCINFEQSKSLMIHCDFKEHVNFAQKVKLEANKMGIFDVCIHVNDMDEIHNYLKNTNLEDIKLNSLIDRSDWNEYALKGGALLFLQSAVPGLMDDIDEAKIKKWIDEREKSIKYYRANVSKYMFPWCIVDLPNERWARQIFGDNDNAYEQLYLSILKMCMVDKKDPLKAWDEFIQKNNYYKNRLNELEIKKMHYTNSLGTDLEVGLAQGVKWLNIDKPDYYGNHMIANMPCYEIFTTPDYRLTNGIVYSSKPLYFNDCLIDDFYITYKNGRVQNCKAKVGQRQLETLLFCNENSRYLGEVALVSKNTPIAQTGLIFNETLFDENSSSHLAIGYGAEATFIDQTLSEEEKIKRGLNVSNVHVDFMIGTDDLNIEAETAQGRKLIFKNGDWNI